MKKFGGYLIFFGIGSMVLNLLDREFILLAWIDFAGPAVAWGIRIALVVGGIAMLCIKGEEA